METNLSGGASVGGGGISNIGLKVYRVYTFGYSGYRVNRSVYSVLWLYKCVLHCIYKCVQFVPCVYICEVHTRDYQVRIRMCVVGKPDEFAKTRDTECTCVEHGGYNLSCMSYRERRYLIILQFAINSSYRLFE